MHHLLAPAEREPVLVARLEHLDGLVAHGSQEHATCEAALDAANADGADAVLLLAQSDEGGSVQESIIVTSLNSIKVDLISYTYFIDLT